MFSYFKNGRKKAHASIRRDCIEYWLVKEFHWPPQIINQIPQKWMDKFILMTNLESEAAISAAQTDQVKKLIREEVDKQSGKGKKSKRR